MVGFPLCMVLLNESIMRLRKRGKALANPLVIVRNWVLPILALFLLLTRILGLSEAQTSIRLVQTALLLVTIHLSLSLVNVLLFVEAGSNTWQAQVPKLLRDLTRFFLILVGTALVLSTVWKADLGGLLTALGVSSIVIGLALQDTLGNLFAGIALLFGRPFKVGDWLQVGETIGKVHEVNWRAVHLMTREQEMLIVPNSVLAKEIFTNFNRPLRMHVEPVDIGFSYDDPPNKVKQVLKEAALATKGVLPKPEPVVQTLNYGDSSIDYRVRLFLADYSKVPQIRDEFMTRIWYATQRYSLNIPFPIRTVFHEQISRISRSEKIAQTTAELRSLPWFAAIDPDTLADLVQDVSIQTFGKGDRVIEQGQSDVKLHLILSGKAKVTAQDPANIEREVTTLGRGEFFGTLSLLGNEPCPNSITALEDIEAAVFDTEALHILLARTPQLARDLGELIETRRKSIRLATQARSFNPSMPAPKH